MVVFSLEKSSIISSIFYINILLLVHFSFIDCNQYRRKMKSPLTITNFISTLYAKSVLKMLPKSWICQKIRRKMRQILIYFNIQLFIKLNIICSTFSYYNKNKIYCLFVVVHAECKNSTPAKGKFSQQILCMGASIILTGSLGNPR